MARRGLLAWSAAAVAVVAVNVWVAGSDALVDLSEGSRFSLSAESREIAGAVDAPLDVSAFLYEHGGAARDVRFLLNRYRELNRHIDYRIVDPDERPGEAARYGITGYSTLVFEYEGRRIDATAATELEISSAILRVLRGTTQTACFLTGHGEASLDDEGPDGLSQLAALLERNGYEPVPLDLRRRRAVPDECSLVAIVGATVALLPNELTALIAYAEDAGRLAVLASPFHQEADPNPLLEPWGIAFAGGLAVDPDRAEGADLSNVIVSEFPTSNPVVEGVPSLQFPAPGGLLVTSAEREGLTVSALAVTSPTGFVEVRPDVELEFNEGDIPGPVVLAAAADDSRVEPTGETRVGENGPSIVRTRVFATGNALWVTNRFIDRLGNRRFAVNAMGWLAQEEQILTVGAEPPTRRELPWTPERERRVAAVAIVGVPGVVLGAGALRWWWVRRRR